MIGKAGLPPSSWVDIGTLARLFDDCVTSYKYFFFLALLNRVSGKSGGPDVSIGDRPIPLRDLAVDMVLGAWYPHGFCRLSLGLQDMLQPAVDEVFKDQSVRGTWIAAGGGEWRRLRALCEEKLHPESFLQYVPFRLLRPFFARELRGSPDQMVNARIADLADEYFSDRRPLYCFTSDRLGILLHHDWLEYIQRNSAILEGWARFRLAEYLQARNPNTPAVIEKIAPPTTRGSLAAQTTFWREALARLEGSARCIYSGERLDLQSFSLDHYLPWSFVSHDRLWNLVPIPRSVNSSKSDCLPDAGYLAPFAELQSSALGALKAAWPEGRWLRAVEPFLADLRLGPGDLLEPGRLRNAYEATVLPLAAIAERQGFAGGWVYRA